VASWNPRTVVGLSWAFPIAAAGVGGYAVLSAVTDPMWILVAAASLALTSLVGVATSSSGNKFTTGLAVAAALPFVFSSPVVEGLGGVDLAAVIAAYGFGLAAVWALRFARGEGHHEILPVMVRRFAGYLAYAVIYSTLRTGRFEELSGDLSDLVPFLVALVGWLVVEVLVRALLVFGARDLSRTYLARAMLQDLNVFVGLALTGALFGELVGPLGAWAVPIALLPYSLAHSAFKRFQETKVTYKQTIRALARIPEVSGLAVDGHADRTTALATSIAKEMGVGPGTVEQVEFAALMHDIGRVSLNEPQVLRMGFTDDDIARWSAEIIAESPYLEKVAHDVRQQYEPYRKPGEQEDPAISIVSRIIKVAAAYDWNIHQDGLSPLQALESLHEGAAYDYHPQVVASLRRLLVSRGQLTPARAGK
jgi:hypothetical protein